LVDPLELTALPVPLVGFGRREGKVERVERGRSEGRGRSKGRGRRKRER